MSVHWIHGSLGREAPIRRLGGRPVVLDAGILWVPWNGPQRFTVDDGAPPTHEYLSDELAARHAAASGAEGLAFFETRYWGGTGEQVASAWVDGLLVLDRGTVDEALVLLGVVPSVGGDAWDVVGLAHHRSNPR